MMTAELKPCTKWNSILTMLLIAWSLLVINFGTFANSLPSSDAKAFITIIIDDIGAKPNDRKAFNIDKRVTFSILPHTEYSEQFSFMSAAQNREVMLHMPMESLHNENLGPGPLLTTMYPQEVERALLSALQTVPHAVGVNNHMGSKLTQMTLQMSSLMATLEKNNLFFIDSRTTKFSKAKKIAARFGVKTARRNIFLDHVQNESFLNAQFDKLIDQAQREGKAIGIGHPYPVTISFLEKKLANLPKNIELITVSQYLDEENKFRINPLLAAQTSSENYHLVDD